VKSNGITITLLKDDPEEHWTDVRPKVGLFGKTAEEKKEDKDPMKSMQNMLKNMYNNGDDKTKSMIAESW